MTHTRELVDVVVGGGSGMGAAVAARLAGSRRMIVADQNEDAATRVAELLGDGVEPARCDVTDNAACEALASKVGGLGKLVMTAGLSPTMAEPARIMEVNLAGSARVLNAFAGIAGEGTAAVVFASTAGHVAFPMPPDVLAALDDPLAPDLPDRLAAAGMALTDPGLAYMLSKLGVIRLMRRSAPEWWKLGARLTSLSPGIIDTPMGNQELEQQPMMAGVIDLVGRWGTADEVAAVAAFLVSDDASFVNGVDVLVDGGAGAIMAPGG